MVKRRAARERASREDAALQFRKLLALVRSVVPSWAKAPTEQAFCSLYRANRGHALDPTAYGCKSARVLLSKLLRAAAEPETLSEPEAAEQVDNEHLPNQEGLALDGDLRWRPPDIEQRGDSPSLLHEQMLALAKLAAPDELEVRHLC